MRSRVKASPRGHGNARGSDLRGSKQPDGHGAWAAPLVPEQLLQGRPPSSTAAQTCPPAGRRPKGKTRLLFIVAGIAFKMKNALKSNWQKWKAGCLEEGRTHLEHKAACPVRQRGNRPQAEITGEEQLPKSRVWQNVKEYSDFPPFFSNWIRLSAYSTGKRILFFWDKATWT